MLNVLGPKKVKVQQTDEEDVKDKLRVENESNRSVKANFTDEDMLRMAECPSLMEDDKFFKEFWPERSQKLNERFLEQEKILQLPIRAKYNAFNHKVYSKFKQDQFKQLQATKPNDYFQSPLEMQQMNE